MDRFKYALKVVQDLDNYWFECLNDNEEEAKAKEKFILYCKDIAESFRYD